MNTTWNIQNPQGNNSFGGNAENSGNISFTLDQRSIAIAQTALKAAEAEIEKLDVPQEVKSNAIAAIAAAKANPSKETVSKAVAALEAADKVGKSLSGIVSTGVTLAPYVMQLAQLLGAGS